MWRSCARSSARQWHRQFPINDREIAVTFHLIAFSSRQPVSTSLENAHREARMTIQTNRRGFIAAMGSLTIAVALPGGKAKAAVANSRIPLKPENLSTYISIDRDGS